MTERTRKSGVGKVYESCRSLVGPLALAVTLSAGAVYAGAWEEFEQRCLLAYEHGVPAITDGLQEAELPGLAGHEIAYFGLTGGALMILEGEPEDGLSACRVFFTDDATKQAFEAWSAAQLSDTRYVRDETREDGSEIALHSHLWIEPVIGVQLRPARGAYELRVVETELES